MEELLNQLLLQMNKLQADVAFIKRMVAPDIDAEGVMDGFDLQEIGGYVVSMTKKEGNNGKKNVVVFV